MGRATETCAVDGCGRRVWSRGLCLRHYLVAWRAKALPPRIRTACAVEGCGRPSRAYGLCVRHAKRLQRGAPLEGGRK